MKRIVLVIIFSFCVLFFSACMLDDGNTTLESISTRIPKPTQTLSTIHTATTTNQTTTITSISTSPNTTIVTMLTEVDNQGISYFLNDNNTYSVVGYKTWINNNITIPRVFNDLPVINIDDEAFHGCQGLRWVTILDNISRIGNSAFGECRNLLSVDMSNAELVIGDYCFAGCTSLNNVLFPNNLAVIGEGTFSNCNDLVNLDIPDTVIQIGDFAFYDCAKLESITIPDGVTTISIGTFMACSSLTNIVFSPNITHIYNAAFYNCSSFIEFTIPNGVLYLENQAFDDCYNLTTINIPSSLISIGQTSFWNCPKLEETNVDLENAVYSSVDGILFNKNLTTLLFYPKNKLGSNYTISSTVSEINEYAFMGLNNLENLYIPLNVTTIKTFGIFDCIDLTIYVEATSKPNLWQQFWIHNSNNTIIWGHTIT